LAIFFTASSGHPGCTVKHLEEGLPDGLFSNQKFQFGYILEGFRWEKVEKFYGHLEYFMDILDIL
jgi:hypothetical protein